MRLRLKEDPREWRKFAWALSAALSLVTGLLIYRSRSFGTPAIVTLPLAIVVFVTGTLWPRPYRPVYRVAMRVSHAIGQVVGKVLLGVFFLLLVLPLSLVLRLLGKDLLRLRQPRQESVDSYWQPVKLPGPLDRMF